MARSKKIIHQITKSDVKKCWDFGLKYFLDESKSIQNRTVGQNRGVGGILDSFSNKIVEIAVCSEIEKMNKKIKCVPDFEIHKLAKGKTEPDVFKIIEKKTERNPNLYVEIKNITNSDNWLGPKSDEVSSILNNVSGIKRKKDMYYVYGEIKDAKRVNNESRKSSVLGAYLKHLLPNDITLKEFHSIRDLSVEIKYVFTIKDIEKYGTKFPKGGFMTNPEIFSELKTSTKKRILKNMKNKVYKNVPIKNNTLPRYAGTYINKKGSTKTKILPYPKPFGDTKFTGKIEMCIEKRSTRVNRYFHCLSTVKFSNKVLGTWKFKKGDVVNYKIFHSGWDPELRKNNTFVARRNNKITSKMGPRRLKEIARKI